MLEYGPRFTKLFQTGVRFVGQVKESEKTPLLSVLLEGPPGSGKTALAAALVCVCVYHTYVRVKETQYIDKRDSIYRQKRPNI